MRIKEAVSDDEDKKYNIRSTYLDGSKLEHYLSIKQLEGEILNYALKIQVDDQDEKDSESSTSQKINQLISVVRAGVYSAKSLKDVNENLESFHLINKPIISKYFKELKFPSKAIYSNILALLIHHPESEITTEEVYSLKEKTNSFHHDFSKNIYDKIDELNLTAVELSTLLNVNKEIHTSEKTLLKAIETINTL